MAEESRTDVDSSAGLAGVGPGGARAGPSWPLVVLAVLASLAVAVGVALLPDRPESDEEQRVGEGDAEVAAGVVTSVALDVPSKVEGTCPLAVSATVKVVVDGPALVDVELLGGDAPVQEQLVLDEAGQRWVQLNVPVSLQEGSGPIEFRARAWVADGDGGRREGREAVTTTGVTCVAAAPQPPATAPTRVPPTRVPPTREPTPRPDPPRSPSPSPTPTPSPQEPLPGEESPPAEGGLRRTG